MPFYQIFKFKHESNRLILPSRNTLDIKVPFLKFSDLPRLHEETMKEKINHTDRQKPANASTKQTALIKELLLNQQ